MPPMPDQKPTLEYRGPRHISVWFLLGGLAMVPIWFIASLLSMLGMDNTTLVVVAIAITFAAPVSLIVAFVLFLTGR